jgi:ATP-binding cassette subfamily B protein
LYHGAQEVGHRSVPDAFWSVCLAAQQTGEPDELVVQGTVVIEVAGVADAAPERAEQSVEVAAASGKEDTSPLGAMVGHLRGDGVFRPAILVSALLAAVAGVFVEALALRAALEVGNDLPTRDQRAAAAALLIALFAVRLLTEIGIAGELARLGRRLEFGIRLALSSKFSRLHERYVQSRPVSDLAERVHSLHQPRSFPAIGGNIVRTGFQIAATVAALGFLDSRVLPLAIIGGLSTICIPFFAHAVLAERDMRVRTHSGSLARFYFDALLGLVAVQSHGAEDSLMREQEGLLVAWASASRARLRAVLWVEALQPVVGFATAAGVLLIYTNGSSRPGGALLVAYWALSFPVLGVALGAWMRQYVWQRTAVARALEPLGAAESEGSDKPSCAGRTSPQAGAALEFRSVSVRVGGHTVLSDVQLSIEAGEHVAVIGASGAGKTSLLGVLLGWNNLATGSVTVDGRELDAAGVERLRQETSWLDPSVYLWNQPLIDNIAYGSPDSDPFGMHAVLEGAGLYSVLDRLPVGLQSLMGEGGRLVSGGEGQRVRLGRALMRRSPRLVLLDEPFRGLDRGQRQQLLTRSRERWSGVTMLCVTHDISDTRSFDRVVVMEEGKVVEQGTPLELASTPDSRYTSLLRAEAEVRTGPWSHGVWRTLRLNEGRLDERPLGPTE